MISELIEILTYPFQRLITCLGNMSVEIYSFLSIIVAGLVVTMIMKLFFDRLG